MSGGPVTSHWMFPIVLAAVCFSTFAWSDQIERKATRAPRDCLQCHTHHDTIIRGLLEEVSESGKTVSLATYTGELRTVSYDDKTVVTGWEGSIPGLPRDRGIAITIGKKNGSDYAERIAVRPPPKGRGKFR